MYLGICSNLYHHVALSVEIFLGMAAHNRSHKAGTWKQNDLSWLSLVSRCWIWKVAVFLLSPLLLEDVVGMRSTGHELESKVGAIVP